MKKIATYEELKAGWDRAASINANAAIHPAGNQSPEAYAQSGIDDVNKLIDAIKSVNYWGSPKDIVTLRDAAIIDYGCGNGRLAIPLTKIFADVFAVDMSYAMLQQMPHIDNLYPVLAIDSSFETPFKANMAVSISVFIHNTYENGKKIMQQIANNLLPGGFAFLQIPLYGVPKEPTDWTDVGVWTESQLREAAKQAGMECIKLHANEGAFSFEAVGVAHSEFQILRKIIEEEEHNNLEV